jgi:hypothetical protein
MKPWLLRRLECAHRPLDVSLLIKRRRPPSSSGHSTFSPACTHSTSRRQWRTTMKLAVWEVWTPVTVPLASTSWRPPYSENNIPMTPGWKLPHGWRISAGGLAVPPIPLEGTAMAAYIEHRHRALQSRLGVQQLALAAIVPGGVAQHRHRV